MTERFDESLERPATETERAYVNRALFHLGLYSAELDHYDVTEHPEDRKCAVELETDNAIRSIN